MAVRNGYTPCDWPECDRSAANGDILFRVNEQGVPGIFMCQEHAGRSDEEACEVWLAVAMHTDRPLVREARDLESGRHNPSFGGQGDADAESD